MGKDTQIGRSRPGSAIIDDVQTIVDRGSSKECFYTGS